MMMSVCSSAALKIYPPLQHYDDTTEFTSFICSNDDDSYTDDVEWLYPNFTVMASTPDYRIDGIISSYRTLLLYRSSLYTYIKIKAHDSES